MAKKRGSRSQSAETRSGASSSKAVQPKVATQGTTVVIGDGWGALAAVSFVSQMRPEHRIVWLPNSGSRILPPVSALESGPGVAGWAELARVLGVDCSDAAEGTFLREFRNKSFRPVAWSKPAELEMRREERSETIWAPEVRLAPLFESRFEQGLWELEEQFRARVAEIFSEQQGRMERRDGVPVQGLRTENDRVSGVILGSGEIIESDQVIYADRWSGVAALDGIPKGFSLSRRREPYGVLQAVFNHKSALRAGLSESFYAACHKDAGEEIERHAWGYFSCDGKRSVWTLMLGSDEGEDNHQIARKLRRLKQALDRMFTGSEWLPSGFQDFMQTVESEQVRFEEAALFASGDAPTEATPVPGLPGILFVTDGYGPACALEQVIQGLGVEIRSASPAGSEQVVEGLVTGVDNQSDEVQNALSAVESSISV